MLRTNINHEIENPCGLFGGFAPYGAKLAEIFINHKLVNKTNVLVYGKWKNVIISRLFVD